jgi:hypothetical protein
MSSWLLRVAKVTLAREVGNALALEESIEWQKRMSGVPLKSNPATLSPTSVPKTSV